MLTLDNLSLVRGNKKIFSDLGFSLSMSSTMVITGKNGCGKTSLLKIIAGISKATSGNIFFDQEDIENFRDIFNGDLQFLGHKNFLKSELSVLENLRFYAKLSDTEILLPAALNFFKLNDIANKKVSNLSYGWQKRVMLAKLVCCPTLIWLLDEPSVGLDREGRELLKGLIKTRAREDGMVFIATHDEELFDLGVRFNLEEFGI